MFAIIGKKIIPNLIIIFLCYSNIIFSDTINISHHTKNKSMRDQRPFIDLRLEKNEFFVGEYVPFALRISYDAHSYDVQKIIPPSNPDFIFKDIAKPKKWRDTLTDAWIVEWEGAFYATKNGRLSCGPFQIIMQQRMSHTSSWAFFTTQQVVSFESDAVFCKVLALPLALDREIHPIGVFKDAHLEVDQHDFQVGQAITLHIHMTAQGRSGSGHALPESYPQLDLPKGLKWYFSDMKEDQEGVSFTYIVQALKDDIFIIPAQKCIFFDPVSRSYRTLTTETARLFVTPGVSVPATQETAISTASPQSEDAQKALEEEVQEMEKENNETDEKQSFMRTCFIPDFVIFILLICMMIGAIGYRMRGYIENAWLYWQKKWRYKKLVREARATIRSMKVHALKKDEHAVHLYEIFKKLQSEVNWEKFNQKNLLSKEYHSSEWSIFWQKLEALRFADDDSVYKDQVDELIAQANQWLLFFERKVA